MNEEKLGDIQSVDTGTVTIQIAKKETLNNLQVNQLLKIRSTNSGESIIALVNKIMRKAIEVADDEASDNEAEKVTVENLIKALLIGTWFEAEGTESNVFKRSLETVPSIGSDTFLLKGEELKEFMGAVSSKEEDRFELGKYTIQKDTAAFLDGNKFFQRHAVVVGGTGSGKSWAIAKILEKASELPSVNSIIFDLHGEYQPLGGLGNTTTLKIAGPSDDKEQDNTIFLPYWLLSYEEMEALLLDRSDQNAPNQARALFDLIIELKKQKLDVGVSEQEAVLNNFTIDSPIPFDLCQVLKKLKAKDTERISSGSRERDGPLAKKLTRFIQRLESKRSDKRLNFLFSTNKEIQKYEWFQKLVNKLMAFEKDQLGSKIIDFSEVPSDILPLIAGLMARLVFSIQQWTDQRKRHPIVLFCDEAHLYIPNDAKDSIDTKGLHNFERIAKEGRKYGVSLVVISQRPADVSKTVLSQCVNFISLRLTNPDDQNVIKRLFPDSLGGFSELLPILDIGECLIVGDASLLPCRVKIDEPNVKPSSSTIDTWTEWKKDKQENALLQAVKAMRQQSKQL